jgi:hypothetical protein
MTVSPYNGWSSYPTWAVYLWLSNDQLMYNIITDFTKDAGGSHRAAESIKEFVEDDNPYADGMPSRLLCNEVLLKNASLSSY